MGKYEDNGLELDKDFLAVEGKIHALVVSIQGINQAVTQLSDAAKSIADTIIKLTERVDLLEEAPIIEPGPTEPVFGCPTSVQLTDYNPPDTSGVVTLPAGFKGDGLRFHGIVVPAGPCEITRSVMRGPKDKITKGNHALFRAYNKRPGQAVFSQVTFAPQTLMNGLDCILGWQYDLFRCDLSGGIDGMGIYATTTTGSNNASVHAEDVWVHDLTWTWPDDITYRADGSGTHCDAVQIQGGEDISLKRMKIDAYVNVIPGTQTPADKKWMVEEGKWAGSGITIQTNTGIQAKANIEDIIVSGGQAQYNIKPGVVLNIAGYSRHSYDVANHDANPKYSRYYIRFDKQSATTYSGLERAVFMDGPEAGKRLVDTARGVTTNA